MRTNPFVPTTEKGELKFIETVFKILYYFLWELRFYGRTEKSGENFKMALVKKVQLN